MVRVFSQILQTRNVPVYNALTNDCTCRLVGHVSRDRNRRISALLVQYSKLSILLGEPRAYTCFSVLLKILICKM